MFRRALSSLLLLPLIALTLHAQIETGQITGKIYDANGDALPGATVTAKTIETGAERTATTNREGIYVLPNLQPGRYVVTITANGFAKRGQGLHVRVGIEDNLWGRKGERITSVQQVEQMVRISRELHREVATGAQAKAIYRIGEHYASTDETLAKLGYAPNRKPGMRGATLRLAA